MKKIISLAVLITAFYLVVADGMMVHFGLERVYQYAFNFAAIFLILPVSLFVILGMTFKEEESI